MSDGWTGINIDEVKGQLDAFDETMKNIVSEYRAAFDLLNEELYSTWASKNAVDFNANLLNLSHIIFAIDSSRERILYSAALAARYMAKHNGADFSYDAKVPENLDRMYDFKRLEESKNGIMGMNVALAKVAVSTFTDSYKNVASKLDSISVNFSLLDPSGELENSYRELINETISHIDEIAESSINVLNAKFEEETNNIILGKQQAENILTA